MVLSDTQPTLMDKFSRRRRVELTARMEVVIRAANSITAYTDNCKIFDYQAWNTGLD